MSVPSSERTEGGKGEGVEEGSEKEQLEQPPSAFGETGGENAFSFVTGGADESLFSVDRSHEMEGEEAERGESEKKFVDEWGPLTKKEFEDKRGPDAYKWVHIPSHLRIGKAEEWTEGDMSPCPTSCFAYVSISP